MTTRTYGERYHQVTGGATEIAKAMRADIKRAVAKGTLPDGPTYSVTSEHYSGGQSINITVRGWSGAWVDCDGSCTSYWCSARNDSPHASAHKVLNPAARRAQIVLERIHGAYNHDGSDTMTDYFDVRYYGQVTFETAESAAWRAEDKARKAAAKVAREAAVASAETVRLVNYSNGQRIVHDAVEVDGRLRLVCGARGFIRGMFRAREGDELTCSRCAKKAAGSAQVTA